MEWDELPIANIEKTIGYSFLDKDLLKQAFTTVWYWYKKTGYDHNLPNYIGNAIIMDEVDALVKEGKLTNEQANEIKTKFYAKWHQLMVDLEFDTYQIKLFPSPDDENERQEYFDVANIFPLLICAVYFDQKKQCTDEVKHVVDTILGVRKEFNFDYYA